MAPPGWFTSVQNSEAARLPRRVAHVQQQDSRPGLGGGEEGSAQLGAVGSLDVDVFGRRGLGLGDACN